MPSCFALSKSRPLSPGSEKGASGVRRIASQIQVPGAGGSDSEAELDLLDSETDPNRSGQKLACAGYGSEADGAREDNSDPSR